MSLTGAAVRPDPPIIQLPLFVGPLELLLSLVERRRLPITELSLASVAGQYLSSIRSFEQVDGNALSEFLFIAARLVLIKSRELLPRIVQEVPDDELTAEDLVRQLQTYRAFKLLAAALTGRESSGTEAFPREPGRGVPLPESTSALAPIPVEALALLMIRVQQRRERIPRPAPEALVRTSVATRVGLLRQRLARSRTVQWAEVAGATIDEIVATLLAVLELVRRGEISVEQPNLFGPILLHLLEEPSVVAGREARVRQTELAQ